MKLVVIKLLGREQYQISLKDGSFLKVGLIPVPIDKVAKLWVKNKYNIEQIPIGAVISRELLKKCFYLDGQF